jgi:hypothetical protein
MTDKDELAALKKKVEELEAKVSPPKSDFVPMTDAEHQNWVHQMRERRMSAATPPEMVRDWAVIPEHIVRGIVNDRHAPTGRPGMIPEQPNRGSTSPAPSTTPGYVDPRPLSNPPGVNWADKLMDAQDARDRAELIEREAKLQAMEKLSEQGEKLQKLVEQNKKLTEPGK